MSEQPRLLEAYRRAHEAANPAPLPEPSPVPTEPGEPPDPPAFAEGGGWTTMAAALEAAGWEYRIRMGRRIWCKSRDDLSCGWKGEEFAYMWMQRGEV